MYTNVDDVERMKKKFQKDPKPKTWDQMTLEERVALGAQLMRKLGCALTEASYALEEEEWDARRHQDRNDAEDRKSLERGY